MGTTLSNGVYLPDEGERNCYAGLKVNWEILNQKVADIVALQLAIAGALHREIVASLPTTDIDPNTIYMILNGTSATENVYNEYMYVNNAWELIGTSATDLTNYYTKAEVDGKLLLKANASDLTSHTGDTTIHVTASDKTKWNTVALIKQLRLVNTQVGSATTIAFANIDDTNGIKVGDKCMDLDAKMFEITAVDTTNETVTVGSALIDLALDSDVVHKSGDETISGTKTITGSSLDFKSTSAEYGVSAGDSSVIFRDKNNRQTFKIYSRVFYSGIDNNLVSFFLTQKVDNTYYTSNGIQLLANTGNKDAILRPILANNNADGLSVSLGASDRRWSKIYGTEYYYGSNNVEFSTKFVTTDTNQTISGNKTFSDNLTIYNNDSSQATKNLIISSSKIQVGDTSNSDSFGINFNAGLSYVSRVTAFKDGSGTQNLQLGVRTKDSSNNLITSMVRLRLFANGNSNFESDTDNTVSLGSSLYKFKDVQTYKVNNLEPSSLSLPNVNINSFVDISGYFTNTGNADTNTYNVTANGWVYLRLGDISSCQVQILNNDDNLLYGQSITGSVEQILIPVSNGVKLKTQWATGTSVNVVNARFIPCQGNI